jgi:hypothetical protein
LAWVNLSLKGSLALKLLKRREIFFAVFEDFFGAPQSFLGAHPHDPLLDAPLGDVLKHPKMPCKARQRRLLVMQLEAGSAMQHPRRYRPPQRR